ncbi:hypothetical protein ACFE04_004084 [Oxalis oulophora]
MLASGGLDGRIQIWDAHSGNQKCSLEGPGGPVEVKETRPLLCTGSDDATLRIWNPELIFTFLIAYIGYGYHTEGLTCLAITSDSIRAITGSKDGSVYVVNVTSGMVVSSLLNHADSIECV